MFKLIPKWMLYVINTLSQILWIVDHLQEPYQQGNDSIVKLHDKYNILRAKLEEVINE